MAGDEVEAHDGFIYAELFQTTPDNIGLHLRNIYAERELKEKATAEDFSVVQNEGGRGVRRSLKHYSLDAIIAVGYRVSSKRATQFRIWATQTLKEYIRKGFVLSRSHKHRLRFDPVSGLRVGQRGVGCRQAARHVRRPEGEVSGLRGCAV